MDESCESSSSVRVTQASVSLGILILLILLILSLIIGQLLRIRDCKYLNETAVATLIGVGLGAMLMSQSPASVGGVMRLNTEIFLLLILPPVIFESGFSLDKAMFFKELGGILTFAFLGTLISSSVTGLLLYAAGFAPYVRVRSWQSLSLVASFAFGTLLSATDTLAVLGIMRDMQVHRQLYTLIFGESIFNDAITVVLYRTFVALHHDDDAWEDCFQAIWRFFYVFFTSFFVGVLAALAVSFLLKFIERSSPANRLHIEASAVVFGPWVCYLVAEALQLSGIVSILFCGMFMARYTVPNLSEMSRAVVGRAYSVCAHAAEVLVFIFLGLGLFSFDLSFSSLGIGLFCSALLATLLARACNILCCSALLNCFRRHKISFSFQLVMWIAAPRGAIAFALSISALREFGNEGEAMLTFTLLYSILSVSSMQICLVGVFIAPLLQRLPVTAKDDEEQYSDSVMDDNSSCIKRLKAKAQAIEQDYLYPFFVSEDKPTGLMVEVVQNQAEQEMQLQLGRMQQSHKSESSRELADLEYNGSETYVHSAIHLN
jgi:sodium/hydrogen exchanger 8